MDSDTRPDARPNDLLTTDEVAQMLRTTPGTMRWYASVGRGPEGFRLGRRRVYRRADVEAYIENARKVGA